MDEKILPDGGRIESKDATIVIFDKFYNPIILSYNTFK
jgi:hypothetical protein